MELKIVELNAKTLELGSGSKQKGIFITDHGISVSIDGSLLLPIRSLF